MIEKGELLPFLAFVQVRHRQMILKTMMDVPLAFIMLAHRHRSSPMIMKDVQSL